jgi:hypothetical protein
MHESHGTVYTDTPSPPLTVTVIDAAEAGGKAALPRVVVRGRLRIRGIDYLVVSTVVRVAHSMPLYLGGVDSSTQTHMLLDVRTWQRADSGKAVSYKSAAYDVIHDKVLTVAQWLDDRHPAWRGESLALRLVDEMRKTEAEQVRANTYAAQRLQALRSELAALRPDARVTCNNDERAVI